MEYTNLKNFCSLITKGTTPTTAGFEFQNNGVNFVKSECIDDSRHLNKNKFSFISSEANDKLFRSQLQENDILLSIAGAYLGKTAIVEKNILPANTNQAVAIIRCNCAKIIPLFLYYYLCTDKVNSYINNVNAQSAQPNINLAQIGNIQIPICSLSYQQHIIDTRRCYYAS